MDDGHIAKRYAQALLEYATTHGEDDRLYQQMKVLLEAVAGAPHFMATLASPVVPTADKLQLLITAVGTDVAASYRRFAQLLLDNRRERQLRHIALTYISLYRQAHHIGVVVLISVELLPAAVIDRILKSLVTHTYSAIEVENRIDPSIKGGFIFQIDDLRLDASVAGQLDKVRRQFIRKNKIIA